MNIDYLPSQGDRSGIIRSSWSGTRGTFPKSVRQRILERYPTCNWPGCEKPSEVADHIVPWAEAVRLGWDVDEINDISNGQGLCNEHHEVKTKEERLRGIKRKSRTRERERHPGLL